jgi:pumilio family protein 6
VSTKDRKHIVKVLKPHIETMAKDEDAQYVLFTALDVIEYVVSKCRHIFRS